MKRWYANYLMRWAFRVFRRYHEQLPTELNGIIWGEITRKPEKDYFTIHHPYSKYDPNCSMCVRELEEDQQRQETIQRWLKGETWSER